MRQLWIRGASPVVRPFGCIPSVEGTSKDPMQPDINTVSAILIAHDRDFPLRLWLVLQLDRLALRRGHVRAEGHEETARDPLLNRYLRPGVLASTNCGINGQLRDAGQALHAFCDLSGNTLRDYGFRAEGRRGGGIRRAFASGLAKSKQINNVQWRQRRVGGVGRLQPVRRSAKIDGDVVLLHDSFDVKVYHRFGASGIREYDRSILNFKSLALKKKLAVSEVDSSEKHGFGRGSRHGQIRAASKADLAACQA